MLGGGKVVQAAQQRDAFLFFWPDLIRSVVLSFLQPVPGSLRQNAEGAFQISLVEV